jgi:tricorn protease
MKKLLLLTIVCLFTIHSFCDEARLLRFPALSGENIVFSYAGDLFIVNSSGGIARRLTTHEGYEMFPRFSPDGNTIAFTAQYDGNTEVYIMPTTGGTPKRITYTATLSRDDVSDRMGPNNIVMGWTNDGKNVVFRSRMKSFNSFKGHLFLAPIDGGLHRQIELATGSWCSYSSDGNKLAMNRVFREFRTWKYYKGGMADDIWIHDLNTKETINVTNSKSQDIFPMWYEDKVYFLSDRDRIMNLFVYDTVENKSRKLTNFVSFDIKFPSMGDGKIVFENGGYIYIYHIEEARVEKLKVKIQEDLSSGRTKFVDASEFINSVAIAPDGSRLVVSARGEIFSVPVKNGITRRLTNNSGVHNRNAVWSPDGKSIAFISDQTGEYQIYIIDPQKPCSEKKISKIEPNYIYQLKWSPDSKKIMWNDKKLGLHILDVKTGKSKRIHSSIMGEIHDFNWSPDSKWIAFTDRNKAKFLTVFLYSLRSKEKFSVSSDWYQSYNPAFSDDGKYLFFVSNRDFNPIYSLTEWNIAYRDMSRIFFLTLDDKTVSPFAPKNTEVFEEQQNKSDTDEVIVNVVKENITDRIEFLPGDPGSYTSLNFVNNKLYYVYRKQNHPAKFMMYDFIKLESVELGEYASFDISTDKKKMLLRKNQNYYVIDLPASQIKVDKPVSFEQLNIPVDLKEEWNQIYNEAWRQMRDYFYDPGMHGVDWDNIRKKYADLVYHANHRDDLNYIIGEMIGELNAGHAYINGGDRVQAQRIKTGLLGAELTKDRKSGYFVIDKILKGKNWKKNLRSPLIGQGIDIQEGEYIISINNIYTNTVENIYELLLGQAGNTVEIEVNNKPNDKNARKYLIQPVEDESQLYYFQWVQENIRKVNEATEQRVGYLHVPDMSVTGLNEFIKYYYPQLAKEALIIDDRGNGGGNVSPMLIERLKREMSIMVMSRDVPTPSVKPSGTMIGPKVLLVDQYSASDGDLFPYQFRRHRLGDIVGVTTWGGVIGIRGSLPFIDGADLRKPEFAHYNEKGWILEGEGLKPDIIVENDPYLEFKGVDAQLNKAIEVILYELEKISPKTPEIPKFPDKSGKK